MGEGDWSAEERGSSKDECEVEEEEERDGNVVEEEDIEEEEESGEVDGKEGEERSER